MDARTAWSMRRRAHGSSCGRSSSRSAYTTGGRTRCSGLTMSGGGSLNGSISVDDEPLSVDARYLMYSSRSSRASLSTTIRSSRSSQSDTMARSRTSVPQPVINCSSFVGPRFPGGKALPRPVESTNCTRGSCNFTGKSNNLTRSGFNRQTSKRLGSETTKAQRFLKITCESLWTG